MTRSEIMRRIKGKLTGPERKARAELRRIGARFRGNVRGMPGTPDLVVPASGLAILVHGCFWHRCPRCRPRVPRTNRAFWLRKFRRNVARDARTVRELARLGWRVLVVYEHELAGEGGLARIRRAVQRGGEAQLARGAVLGGIGAPRGSRREGGGHAGR